MDLSVVTLVQLEKHNQRNISYSDSCANNVLNNGLIPDAWLDWSKKDLHCETSPQTRTDANAKARQANKLTLPRRESGAASRPRIKQALKWSMASTYLSMNPQSNRYASLGHEDQIIWLHPYRAFGGYCVPPHPASRCDCRCPDSQS